MGEQRAYPHDYLDKYPALPGGLPRHMFEFAYTQDAPVLVQVPELDSAMGLARMRPGPQRANMELLASLVRGQPPSAASAAGRAQSSAIGVAGGSGAAVAGRPIVVAGGGGAAAASQGAALAGSALVFLPRLQYPAEAATPQSARSLETIGEGEACGEEAATAAIENMEKGLLEKVPEAKGKAKRGRPKGKGNAKGKAKGKAKGEGQGQKGKAKAKGKTAKAKAAKAKAKATAKPGNAPRCRPQPPPQWVLALGTLGCPKCRHAVLGCGQCRGKRSVNVDPNTGKWFKVKK